MKLRLVESCRDYDTLQNNLSLKQLMLLESILEHYEDYLHNLDESKIIDDSNNYVGDYIDKYGNGDVIRWYYGTLDTDDLLTSIENGETLFGVKKDNIKNKVIEIEDYDGNGIMYLEIDNDGNIVRYGNCDVADITDDYILNTNKELIRIQQTEEGCY